MSTASTEGTLPARPAVPTPTLVQEPSLSPAPSPEPDVARSSSSATEPPRAPTGSTAPPGGVSTASPGPHADAILDRAVIVALDVEWRPEHELSAEQVVEQRARVQTVQDEVLLALGRHGRLRRPLHETAQTALLVDPHGLALLRGHPRVVSVSDDGKAPATGG